MIGNNMKSFKNLLPAPITGLLKNKKIVSSLLVIILFLTFSFPVYSQSSTYFQNAKTAFDRYCKGRITPTGTTAINCFAFEKVLEIQESLNSLNTRITNLESNKISSLEQRISSLEASLSALTITPTPDTTPFEASMQIIEQQSGDVTNNYHNFTATISANKEIKSCNYSYNLPEVCTGSGGIRICTGGNTSGTGTIDYKTCTFSGGTNGRIDATVTSFQQETKNLNYSF